MCIYIYIYIYSYLDAVGSPHRAQLSHFELFELILIEVRQTVPCRPIFEAAVPESTVPLPPPLKDTHKTSTRIISMSITTLSIMIIMYKYEYHVHNMLVVSSLSLSALILLSVS